MLKFVEGFLIIASIFNIGCHTEIPPPPHCAIEKPFKKNDGYCANFYDICVKTGDQQCDNFKSACQQCPPSNYSVIMFQDILYLKSIISTGIVSTGAMSLQNSTDQIRNISIIIIILLSLNILISLLEIRFKLITKLFNINSKSSRYKILKSRKYHEMKGLKESSIKSTKDEILPLIENLEVQMNSSNKSVKDKMQSLIQNSKIESYKMKFRIPNQIIDLELYIHENDNIVKLKRLICDKIEGMSSNDYKIMKIKYKGNQLDNNQYLLSCIDSPEIPVYCEVDNDDNNIINTNEIIILKLRANFPVPDMLEIKLSETIGQLKGIISQITQSNIDDLIIMRQSNELDNNRTVEQCKLFDNYWIQVIKIANGTVLFQSMFLDEIQYKCQFCSTDTVALLKIMLTNHLKCDVNNLSFFTNGAFLSQDDYLYKYNLCDELVIKYCNFTDPNIYEGGTILYDSKTIRLSKGKQIDNKEEILMKIYEPFIYENDGNIIDFVSKNLLLFMKTKSHSRFIQLLNVYLCDNKIYLAMENLYGTTLNSFIENDTNFPINEYKIAKWTIQILEGLEYIHKYGFIYMDLNHLNIFIDGYHDVKLPSFNFTDYLNKLKIDEYITKVPHCVLKNISPEIYGKRQFGVKADVWSLGAILIRTQTQTDKNPRPRMENNKMPETMIFEKKENISKELSEFIDLCLIGDVNERASINQLLQTEFIRKYR